MIDECLPVAPQCFFHTIINESLIANTIFEIRVRSIFTLDHRVSIAKVPSSERT